MVSTFHLILSLITSGNRLTTYNWQQHVRTFFGRPTRLRIDCICHWYDCNGQCAAGKGWEQLHASARQSWRGCTTHLWHVPQTVCIQMMLNGLHIRPKNILERVEPVGHETPVEVDQTCKSVIHHVTPWIMPALQRCKVWIQDPRLIDSRFKTLSRVAGVGFHPTNIYKNN